MRINAQHHRIARATDDLTEWELSSLPLIVAKRITPLCPYCGTSGAVSETPLRCACRAPSSPYSYDGPVLRAIPEVGSDTWIEARLAAIWRTSHPASRGQHLWRYTSNGSRAVARHCRLCSGSTSWCGDYPRPLCSIRAETDDVCEHLARVRVEVAAGRSLEDACWREVRGK